MPQLPLSWALVACFAVCTAYALLLSTRRGQWWTLYATWATVVFGCGLVLLFVALVDVEAAQVAALMFAAGGTPIVVRSLWLTVKHAAAWLDYRTRRRGE